MILEWKSSISSIAASDWDRLLKPGDNPCLAHEFFLALEGSGSAAPETGWQAWIFTLRDGSGLAAAAPLWLHGDSDGEYLYDHAFARAASQMGRSWHPKLVGMIPATPASAWRLLVRPGLDEPALANTFLEEVDRLAERLGVSHTVFNYVDHAWEALLGRDWQTWVGQSWLMDLQGISNFGDWLGCFGKNQRRNIRRELESVAAQGFRLELVEGSDAPREWFDHMARLYHQTNDMWGPWAARWVNTDFFRHLGASDEGRKLCAFSVAWMGEEDGSLPIAMAFLLHRGDTLVGRYWGSDVQAPDLHFAVCYYQGVEYALRRGLKWFDPGAGSEHKIRRGFRAVPHHSRFRFRDPVLEELFRQYVPGFNQEILEWIADLDASSPLKKIMPLRPDAPGGATFRGLVENPPD